MRRSLLAASLGAFVLAGCISKKLDTTMPEISYLDRAKYQRQIGNINEAIKLYRLYIDERLKKVDRLHEEDPNYYLIVIGDLLFDSKRVEEAYTTYEEAEQRGVQRKFVVDRYIKVSHWYQSIQNYEMAECILVKHSFLEPLVFEGELDQLNRKHSFAEDLAGKRLGRRSRVRLDLCTAPPAEMPILGPTPSAGDSTRLVAPAGVIR